MVSKDLIERARKLREQIEYYRGQYHIYDKSVISDEALDSLKKELVSIETLHPELITADSPTQRVEGSIKDELKKVKHKFRQWSLNDCFSEEEFVAFDERVKKNSGISKDKNIDYLCEHKIDGLKVVLEYKGGELKVATTRGDGEVGEDVTHNIKTIESVPLRLSQDIDIVVEGEVWMRKSVFKKLNEERKERGEELFANPRNIAAGSIRQLDPKVASERRLEMFVYDISSSEIGTQEDELKYLQSLGFKVNRNFRLCNGTEEVIEYWREWEERRDSEDYFFDGIVAKVNDQSLYKKLGYTGKAPRYAIAFKFKAEQVTTVVLDILFQVGRTGVVTPVASLKPVLVYGSVVSRATLHNEDEIKRLGLKIGDTVILQKAGDVIPQVVQVLKDFRTGKEKDFKMIKKCPVCGSVLIKKNLNNKDRSAGWFCDNKQCPARDRRTLYYFTSKSAFDIDGLGPKVVDLLVDNGLILSRADIFDIKKGDLLSLPRFGEKSAQNLIDAIEKSKDIDLDRFVVSLAIPQVGEETASILARKFGSIESLSKASYDDLVEVSGIGEVVAREINHWFQDEHNKKLLLKLIKQVRIKHPKEVESNKLISGKTFVLTGSLDTLSRDEAKRIIKSLGGETSSSVSNKTDFVLTGNDPGSKFDKAKNLGVKIISEEEFIRMIGEL